MPVKSHGRPLGSSPRPPEPAAGRILRHRRFRRRGDRARGPGAGRAAADAAGPAEIEKGLRRVVAPGRARAPAAALRRRVRGLPRRGRARRRFVKAPRVERHPEQAEAGAGVALPPAVRGVAARRAPGARGGAARGVPRGRRGGVTGRAGERARPGRRADAAPDPGRRAADLPRVAALRARPRAGARRERVICVGREAPGERLRPGHERPLGCVSGGPGGRGERGRPRRRGDAVRRRAGRRGRGRVRAAERRPRVAR